MLFIACCQRDPGGSQKRGRCAGLIILTLSRATINSGANETHKKSDVQILQACKLFALSCSCCVGSLYVWGSCFSALNPSPSPPLPPPVRRPTTLSHATLSHARTHTTVPHTILSQATLSHTALSHTHTHTRTTLSRTAFATHQDSHTHTDTHTHAHANIVTSRAILSHTHNSATSVQQRQDCQTYTHLLRTIFANSDVKCIVRAKTIQLYIPNRNGSVKRPEKVSKSFHRHSMTDCGNRTSNEVT